MATSEPLVPTGLPQGARQEVRQGMVDANIPLAPPQESSGPEGEFTSSPPSAGASVGASGPLDLLMQNGPDAFPFVTDAPPTATPPAPERGSVVSALVESSLSEFGRAVAMRLRQSQGR